MGIVTAVITQDDLQSDGTRIVTYTYTWDTGKVVTIGPKSVPGTFDANADMLAQVANLEAQAAQEEIDTQVNLAHPPDYANPDKVPSEYQDQNDFDRRLLAAFMLEPNAHIFAAAYPFYQAMELRGGANANQRALYFVH